MDYVDVQPITNMHITTNGMQYVTVTSATQGAVISAVTSTSSTVAVSYTGLVLTVTTNGVVGDSADISVTVSAEGYESTTISFTITLTNFLTGDDLFSRQEQIASLVNSGSGGASDWLEQPLFGATPGLTWLTGRVAIEIILGTTSYSALTTAVQTILKPVLTALGVNVSETTLDDLKKVSHPSIRYMNGMS